MSTGEPMKSPTCSASSPRTSCRIEKVSALWMAAASVARPPTLSAAPPTASAVWESASALWESTPSSWARAPSTWESMGATALERPTRRPPASAKESRELESAGNVVLASEPWRLERPWALLCTASFTEVERPLTASFVSLMEPETPLSCSILPDVAERSSSMASSACWMDASICCLLGTVSGRALTLAWACSSEERMLANVLSLSAPTCEMAPSSWPWAQPMSPQISPMLWFASAEMPEMVETPVPRAPESCAPSVWALVRVAPRVSMDWESASESDVALELTWERVVRASATVWRASAMVCWAPERSPERLVSNTWTCERSELSVAVAASDSAIRLVESPCSFSVMVLPTTPTNSFAICVSRVVEPVSVTLGEMALSFSFT